MITGIAAGTSSRVSKRGGNGSIDPVFPRPLGAVQGLIGGGDQLLRVPSPRGLGAAQASPGSAAAEDAGGEGEAAAAGVPRGGGPRAAGPGKKPPPPPAGPGNHEKNPPPAPPSRHVQLAERLAKNGGKGLQHLVADGVAVHV